MEFCPKCGSVILVADKKASCAKCGYKPKGTVKIQSTETVDKKAGIAVIQDDADVSLYPIVSIKCPKCKHGEARFWTLQTRASDESETKFYQCTKCKHTWRVYR